MKNSLAALGLYLASFGAFACTCPLSTQSWWEGSQNVALVRINATAVTSGHPISDRSCIKGEPCVLKQSASFTTVETFKGSFQSIPRLTSGYGSGDCGIPLVSGAYYVLFLHQEHGAVGFCNAAGPYPPRHPYAKYPARLESFVASLRKAAKDPKHAVESRPKPMTYDSMGGL